MILTGARASDYVARLAALLRGARLSDAWPEARRLAAHVEMMAPEVHRGLQKPLEIAPETGLPVWAAWQAVRSDQAGAARVLAGLADQATLDAQRARSDAHGRLADRGTYLRALAKCPLAPLGALQVALRRHEAAAERADFHLALDKLDSEARFVRLAVALAQTGARWRDGLVRLDMADLAEASDEVRSLMYRSASLDAELVFLQLVALPDVKPERVVRGTVGPVWLAGVNWPAWLGPAPSPTAGVAGFGLETAAVDITGARADDPARPALPPAVEAERAEARARHGYRVHWDRRFVATPDAVPAVQAWTRARGCRNVVRALRRRRR